jgi:hypothetical protein
MTDLSIFALALFAIVAIGGTLVAIHDAIERTIRDRRIRADIGRGPWRP